MFKWNIWCIHIRMDHILRPTDFLRDTHGNCWMSYKLLMAKFQLDIRTANCVTNPDWQTSALLLKGNLSFIFHFLANLKLKKWGRSRIFQKLSKSAPNYFLDRKKSFSLRTFAVRFKVFFSGEGGRLRFPLKTDVCKSSVCGLPSKYRTQILPSVILQDNQQFPSKLAFLVISLYYYI